MVSSLPPGPVAAVVGDWTGIPVGRMVRDDVAAVMSLEAQLQKRVVGQDPALRQIAQQDNAGDRGRDKGP